MSVHAGDYKNWVPRGLVAALGTGTGICLAGLFLILQGFFPMSHAVHVILACILGLGAVVLLFFTLWMRSLHRAFSFARKDSLAWHIIEGVASYIVLPQGGACLDIGCGSGALTTACARRNPHADFTGLDRWGPEYRSFSKALCERNARCEGLSNVRFACGDAVSLDYPDETFDAVISNYVYHNIHGHNKQHLLLESLRVLKKGGTFAIHDIMEPSQFGDMEAFVKKLRQSGYEKADLIDTAKGLLIPIKDAGRLGLRHSRLLTGRK